MKPGNIFQGIVALLLLGFSASGLAVTCKATGAGNTASIQIDAVQVSRHQGHNSRIWISHPLKASIHCEDTDHHPTTEEAYLYLDPDNEFANFFAGTGMELRVIFNSTVYTKSSGKIDLKHHAIDPGNPGFNISFQLELVATGNMPTTLPNLNGRTIRKVFVVDGENGVRREGGMSTNFGPALTGLNNISYTQCSPVTTLQGNTGSDGKNAIVDFGTVHTSGPMSGKDPRYKQTFTINADDPSAQEECRGLNYVLSFSNTINNSDNTVFAATQNDSIGVTLQDPTKPGAADLVKNIPIDFPGSGSSNQSAHRSKTYTATLFWLKKPESGPFTIPVTATITFK